MRGQKNIFQLKEQDTTSEKEVNKMWIRHLPDKGLKSVVLKMITNLGD